MIPRPWIARECSECGKPINATGERGAYKRGRPRVVCTAECWVTRRRRERRAAAKALREERDLFRYMPSSSGATP